MVSKQPNNNHNNKEIPTVNPTENLNLLRVLRDNDSPNFQEKPSDLPAMPQTIKSQSIPISGMHRTASEIQLCEDEALADYRDYVVYSRIIEGISRKQETSIHNRYLRQENDKCLAHIMSTRNNQQDPSTLQSMSYHIAQQMALDHKLQQYGRQDDYYCGEDPLEAPYHQQTQDALAEDDDEDIFALEL